ncbi:MAG: conjugative transposon protein TraK [Bacteroidota bacterium]
METNRNINSNFRGIKIVALVSICCSFIYAYYTKSSSDKLVEKSREKIYVLKDGIALELALSRNANENRKAEVHNHLEMFHQFFFNLDPDPQDIKNSINRALYLIDDSGRKYHDVRDEDLYYHKMVEGNISSRVQIDSIVSDMSSAPYLCKVYARQKITRKTSVVFKKLISVCQLRNLKRTSKNPHGLLIERYRLIDNSTYSEKSR